MMLCEKTVPRAKIAPSEVDMDAATMPSKPHPPRNAGGTVVSILINAFGSGFHIAHVGRSSSGEHVSAETNKRKCQSCMGKQCWDLGNKILPSNSA